MDRIEAARVRVLRLRQEMSSPAVHAPCIQCRYYELVCTHPAVSKISPNPITGKLKVEHGDPEKARSEDGACGPEGALFDARSMPATVLVSMLSSSLGRWTLALGALVGGAILFG